MKLKKALIILLSSCLVYHNLAADPILTFYIKPYPMAQDDASSKSMVSRLTNSVHVAKKAIRAELGQSLLSGLFIMYSGFMTIPDPDGQVIFPRKHENPKFSLVITSKVIPVPMAGNTLAHWTLDPESPSEQYAIEKKQDEETGLFYWHVTRTPLPKNSIIPLEAIIILTKPENMYVPTGITLTNDNPNLILPDIYVKQGVNIVAHGLYITNLKHFLGHINYNYKKQEIGYSQHLSL